VIFDHFVATELFRQDVQLIEETNAFHQSNYPG